MSDPHDVRVEEAFHAARWLPATDREAFLERRFPEEPDFVRRVLDLLESADSAESYFQDLAKRVGAPRPSEAVNTAPNRKLGAYRLLEVIGQGGMGTVYRAHRDDALFEKEVAIKVLPPGLGTPELRGRFHAERQILAGLEHPGISRLIDGGVTEDGVPYLVMELVQGLPIDQYCVEHGLGLDARIDLFLEVCEAVEYAHRNLVVHRDLKPDNILVDEEGRVRLLDFGIAKVMSPDHPGSPLADLTRPGARLMTPAFGSPEQMLGRPVTTTSDVYSLGLLLYLLLTDRRAYTVTGLTAAEREEVVCRRDPPPPSRVMAEAGETRRARKVEGDLDAITLTALAKTPELRYREVSALTADLRWARAGHPIAARPHTTLYRASRFIRRNRTLVGAVSAVATLLVVLTGVAVQSARTTAAQAQLLEVERDRAQAEATRAEQVATFLVHAFEQANPALTDGIEATARDILAAGAERANADLAGQPVLRAEMLATLADIYRRLGVQSQGLPLAEEVVAIRESLPETTRQEYFDARFLRAQLTLGNAGVELLRELLPEIEERFVDDRRGLAAFLTTYAGRLYWSSDPEEKLETFERAIVLLREEEPDDRSRLALAHALVNSTYGSANFMPYEESVARGYEALELRRQVHGPEHPTVAGTLSDLALYKEGVDPVAADTLMRQAYEIHRATAGESHTTTITILNNLAGIKRDRGDLVEAEPLFREALRLRQTYQPDERIPLAYSEFGLGVVLLGLGRPDEAIPYLEAVAETFSETDPRGRVTRERLAEARAAVVARADEGG